jgi:G3E family GTPase
VTPIPTILLTGYLGAGKTTLLNHLLGLDEIARASPALVINEFGPVNVDAGLVRSGDWATYEINSGSVFCACTKGQLLLTLGHIAETARHDLVLVEATGVCETGDLEVLFAEAPLAGRYRVQANVCLVDVAAFTKVAPFLMAITNPVARADGLVLNKTDLVSKSELDRVSAVLSDLNARAPQTCVDHGRIAVDFLASLTHVRPDVGAASPPDASLCAVSIETGRPVARGRLLAAIDGLGDRLLRLKGTIRFESGWEYFELAGGQVFARPTEAAERTAFVAIGWRIGADDLRQALV